ncbi:MAG: ribosomal-processing cysteine protease Prp [Butyricicoccus pullicaecorum]|nr:ribosomal-processing cysteine protease Prp [Butyricicoccus pullicaecorum]
MTKVTFYRTQYGYTAVDLIGHAGFAEDGEDIVCAAISSSVQLIHALLFDVQKIAVDTLIEDEGAHIRLMLPQNQMTEGQAAFQAFYLHLSELEQNYSQFIHVTEVYNDAAD